MPFMEPQAVHQACYHGETEQGDVFIVPAWLVEPGPLSGCIGRLGQYLPESCSGSVAPESVERREGYYARFSAPGYLDCTEWDGPYASEKEALDELAEIHDVCRSCWQQCYCGDEPCEGGS